MENSNVFDQMPETAAQSQFKSTDDHTPLVPRSNFRKKNRQNLLVLYITDIILSLFLFGPLVSLFWNFSWEFLDLYFYADEPLLSNLISWLFGLLIVFPTYLFQKDFDSLNEYLENWTNCLGIFFQITLRLVYIYSLSLGVLLQWRGLWNLIDLLFFKDWKSQLSLSIICIAFLSLTRATKTLLSNPFILYRDDYSEFFTGVSRHKLEIPDCPQFSFDFLLCELVECLALTAAWKGIDNLYYVFVYPDNQTNSLIASFTISHVTFFVILIAQHFIFNLSSKTSLFPRLIIENILNIAMFFSAILYWKFYWDIMDVYLFNTFDSDKLYFILMIGHFVSFLIGFSLKTSGLLIGPGVRLLDGEYCEESESYLDIDYLQSMYKNQVIHDENVERRMQIQQHQQG